MGLKEPAFILKIRGSDYFNEELSCLGCQFAEILLSLKDYTESYDWYIFDVLGTSKSSFHEEFPKNLLQHPLAEIEIRAFDYSFFEIYGNDIEVKKTILNYFSKN